MGWVSIKDSRKPEIEVDVLLYDPNYGTCVGFLNERGEFVDDEWRALNAVTHWMPQPLPPVHE